MQREIQYKFIIQIPKRTIARRLVESVLHGRSARKELLLNKIQKKMACRLCSAALVLEVCRLER